MHYACPFLHFSLFQDDIFAEPFLGNLSGFAIFDDLVNTVIQNIHKDLIIFLIPMEKVSFDTSPGSSRNLFGFLVI